MCVNIHINKTSSNHPRALLSRLPPRRSGTLEGRSSNYVSCSYVHVCQYINASLGMDTRVTYKLVYQIMCVYTYVYMQYTCVHADMYIHTFNLCVYIGKMTYMNSSYWVAVQELYVSYHNAVAMLFSRYPSYDDVNEVLNSNPTTYTCKPGRTQLLRTRFRHGLTQLQVQGSPLC